MNINYYAKITAHAVNEVFQKAKSIPSNRQKECAKKADAEPDPRKRQRVYNACMKAKGAGSDPIDAAGEVMRGGSPFKK